MVLGVIFSLAIVFLRKRELVLCLNCDETDCFLRLLLAVPWVGLRSVIVAFSACFLKAHFTTADTAMNWP